MAKVADDSIARPRPGTLFLVATPMGNLADLSPRAHEVLRDAGLLLAEDTRHTAQLLHACGIDRPPGSMESLHEHHERERVPRVIERLRSGTTVALVSDAGTPLVSDPGAVLVREAALAGIPVVAVPGPCAAIAALSLAALPLQRFAFEGFLPAKAVGLHFFLTKKWALTGGYRFRHMSNPGLDGDNEGIDHHFAHMGISYFFN